MSESVPDRSVEQAAMERAAGQVSDVLLNLEHTLSRAKKAQKVVAKDGVVKWQPYAGGESVSEQSGQRVHVRGSLLDEGAAVEGACGLGVGEVVDAQGRLALYGDVGIYDVRRRMVPATYNGKPWGMRAGGCLRGGRSCASKATSG